jgi:PAS domain S-box-containing protein
MAKSSNPSGNRESAILTVSLDAIVSMDHRGLVTEFNPAAEQLFGYSRAEAIGKPLAELIIPAELRDAHWRGLRRYLAGGESPILGKRIEMTALHASGEEFPVELAICRIPSSEPPSFTGFIRDLTESRRMAEALRIAEDERRRLEAESAALAERKRAEARTREVEQQRDYLIAMLEATPDFVGFADARTSQALYVNPAGRRMCGIPDDDDLTRVRIADFHPDWANRRLVEEALPAAATEGYWRGEIAFKHRDGHEIPTLMIVMSHVGTNGEIEIFSTISRDISDQKKAQEVERQLFHEQAARAAAEEAVRTRDDFVAIAGHELRTPLTALLMQVESLQRRREAPGSGERLDRVARSGRRLARLIDQLLDVSRINAGRFRLETEKFDLVALVREIVLRYDDVSAQAGCAVSVGGAERIDGVWDRLRIDQVISNLLSNAIKYGSGKPVEIDLATRDGQALLQVIDHGIGIESQHLGKLFQRFERAVAARSYGGLGLGLWIARQIVDASGGSITVESEPGRGSTFTVALPLP